MLNKNVYMDYNFNGKVIFTLLSCYYTAITNRLEYFRFQHCYTSFTNSSRIP